MKANLFLSRPASWLPVLLTVASLLAVILANTLPALLVGWSLLLLFWMLVARAALGPALAWQHSGWLWGPLALWAVAAAAGPVPEPVYAQTPTLPVINQFIMAVGLLLPLVCWPLWGRPQLWAAAPRPLAWLLLVWPALAAAIVLGRFLLAAGVTVSLLLALLATAVLLGGVPLLWRWLSITDRLPLATIGDRLTALYRALYQAVRDALLLLEGEVGLLWLLGLLVLALLVY